MLKRISIQNFKGIGPRVDIDLRPVTLLFGPNSAGKSTILHAIHFAHAVLICGDAEVDATLLGGDLHLGGFHTYVHQHNLDNTVLISLRFEPSDDDLLQTDAEDEWAEVDEIEVTLEVNWSPLLLLNRAIVTSYAVAINGVDLAQITCSLDGASSRVSRVNTTHPLLGAEESGVFEGSIPCLQGRRSAVPWPDKPLGMEPNYAATGIFGLPLAVPPSSDALATIEHWLRLAGTTAVRHLDRLQYLGPFRTLPPRQFQPPRQPDRRRWASGLGAWDELFGNESLVNATNRWLRQMGVASQVRVDQVFEFSMDTLKERLSSEGVRLLQLLDSETAAQGFMTGQRRSTRLSMVNPQGTANDVCDLGEGIGQVVPVIVSATAPAVTTPSGESMPVSLVAIEQPELHIHPRMQVVLGDLFLSQCHERQFLIETHSEHLMLRLLRRVRETAEGELEPDAPSATKETVAVYYVEQRDGAVVISELRISEDGEFLDRWPEGFFGERLQELL